MSPPIDALNLNQVPLAPQINAPAPTATQNKLGQRQSKAQETRAPAETHKEHIQVDEKNLSLGFTVDHTEHSIKIRITNQDTGELVREFELKGMSQAHSEPRSKGMIVDDQT